MSVPSLQLHGFHWTHPVCGHQIPLTIDPEQDLCVPDYLLEELNLPRPGERGEPFKAYANPANHAWMREKNPNAILPLPANNFQQISSRQYQYGGFVVEKNPAHCPTDFVHPDLNIEKDLDPHTAMTFTKDYHDHGLPPDSSINLGWPGSHVECPICERAKHDAVFAELKIAMDDAAAKGEDWADKAKELSHGLQKVLRAYRPMPLTLKPTRHPEDVASGSSQMVLASRQGTSTATLSGLVESSSGHSSGYTSPTPQPVGMATGRAFSSGMSGGVMSPTQSSAVPSPGSHNITVRDNPHALPVAARENNNSDGGYTSVARDAVHNAFSQLGMHSPPLDIRHAVPAILREEPPIHMSSAATNATYESSGSGGSGSAAGASSGTGGKIIVGSNNVAGNQTKPIPTGPAANVKIPTGPKNTRPSRAIPIVNPGIRKAKPGFPNTSSRPDHPAQPPRASPRLQSQSTTPKKPASAKLQTKAAETSDGDETSSSTQSPEDGKGGVRL